MKHIICRELTMTASEIESKDASWFQTFPPYGRYSAQGAGGLDKKAKDAEFVFDEETAKNIIAAFHVDRAAHPDWPGILVDREHFSEDPEKKSDAMAWATDIRLAEDGSIWTKWTFTPEGEHLWYSKTLVSRSPCFTCDLSKDGKELRPTRLVSIGMTNSPHFKDLSALASARDVKRCGLRVEQSPTHNPQPSTHNPKGEIQMEKILAALGLNPEATEDEALGAIQALKDKASAAEVTANECLEEKKKAEAECRGMKADAFLKAHEHQIADPAKCREVYLKDPDLAEAMIASCKTVEKAETTQQVLTARAKKPEESDVLKQLAACKSAEERCAFAVKHATELAALAK